MNEVMMMMLMMLIIHLNVLLECLLTIQLTESIEQIKHMLFAIFNEVKQMRGKCS